MRGYYKIRLKNTGFGQPRVVRIDADYYEIDDEFICFFKGDHAVFTTRLENIYSIKRY